jgi:redox-sensitive bicupin YhaK (pirin superfamily)
VESPVRTPEQGSCWYLDVRLDSPGSRVFQEIPTGFNAFIYTFGVAPIRVGDESLEAHQPYHTLVLTNKANVTDPKVDPSTVPQENGVWIEHAGKEGQEARFVVIAGQPLDQKVFQYG